jgi:ribosomal protein S18 acetylase RimI-like enzyme
MIEISKLLNDEQKANLVNSLLRVLPEWFGIEEAIIEYVNGARNSDLYVAYQNGEPVGFISLKANNRFTSEIYIMAILREYHKQGIGKMLLDAAQRELVENKVKFLMVKTLGDSHPDEHYKKTRAFYNKVGFYPLEEIKEIWGEENPCLIMVKSI